MGICVRSTRTSRSVVVSAGYTEDRITASKLLMLSHVTAMPRVPSSSSVSWQVQTVQMSVACPVEEPARCSCKGRPRRCRQIEHNAIGIGASKGLGSGDGVGIMRASGVGRWEIEDPKLLTG